MAKMYYDSDANLDLLNGKTVAIIEDHFLVDTLFVGYRFHDHQDLFTVHQRQRCERHCWPIRR